MEKHTSSRSGLITAERRRIIYNMALERGSINVTEVSKELGVNPGTLRRDLDEMDKEGKLIRSHGGATIKETEVVVRPYSVMRNENLQQKAWIGQAALKYLPDIGSVWIDAGSTTYQLAVNMPERWPGQVVTSSPEIALHLVSTRKITAGLLGGIMRMDSFATDCSWAEEIMNMISLDIAFIGASAIDIEKGISAIDVSAALMERRICEHSKKIVLLCDSSKFNKSSFAKIGPVDMVDVIITDAGVTQNVVDELTSRGVEVIIAEQDDAKHG